MNPIIRCAHRAALLSFSLIFCSGMATGQHHPNHTPPDHAGRIGSAHLPGVASSDWAHLHHLLTAARHHLELDRDQEVSLEALHQRFAQPAHESALRMDHLRQLMTEAVHQTVVDESAIRQAARNLADEQEEHFVRLASFLAEVRSIFSEEQLEELHEMMVGGGFSTLESHGTGS